MEKPKTNPDKFAIEVDTKDDAGAGRDNKKATGRRLQDAITSKNPNRKMKLDRRIKSDDRRDRQDPHYKGPARRNSIDTRGSKERRDKE